MLLVYADRCFFSVNSNFRYYSTKYRWTTFFLVRVYASGIRAAAGRSSGLYTYTETAAEGICQHIYIYARYPRYIVLVIVGLAKVCSPSSIDPGQSGTNTLLGNRPRYISYMFLDSQCVVRYIVLLILILQ